MFLPHLGKKIHIPKFKIFPLLEYFSFVLVFGINLFLFWPSYKLVALPKTVFPSLSTPSLTLHKQNLLIPHPSDLRLSFLKEATVALFL